MTDKDKQIQKEEHYTWYCPKCNTATKIDDWVKELKEKGRQEKEAEMIQEFVDIIDNINFRGEMFVPTNEGIRILIKEKLEAMRGQGDKK